MSSFRAPGENWTTTLEDAPAAQAGSWQVSLIDADTHEVIAGPTNAGVTEEPSGGSYFKTFVLPAGVEGIFQGLWFDGTTTLYDDNEVRVSSDYRAPIPVTVVSPIADNGRLLQITVGDDYLAADGRALSFLDEHGAWPDLTGATIALTAKDANADGTDLEATGSVVTPTGANKEVRVELASALTGALEPASLSPFDIQATSVSGHKATLIAGRLLTLASITP